MAASAIRVLDQPSPGSTRNGIEIDVVAGYGTPDDVPETLRHAVRLLAADWYERRGAAVGSEPPVPEQVTRLIAPCRKVRL